MTKFSKEKANEVFDKIFEPYREEYHGDLPCPCCGKKGLWKIFSRDLEGNLHILWECRKKNCNSQL